MDEKTLVVYYSYTGKTEKICKAFAEAKGYPLVKIEEIRPRNTFSAYVIGGFQAVNRLCSKIKPLDIDLSQYDRILLASPIWGGTTPPAINAFLKQASLGCGRLTLLLTCMDPAQRGEKAAKSLEKYGVSCGRILAYNQPQAALEALLQGDLLA